MTTRESCSRLSPSTLPSSAARWRAPRILTYATSCNRNRTRWSGSPRSWRRQTSERSDDGSAIGLRARSRSAQHMERNKDALRMLVRDADNLRRFFGRFAPELTATDYGKEIWALYKSGTLHPDAELTGHFEHIEITVDLKSIVREINSARLEEAARQIRS